MTLRQYNDLLMTQIDQAQQQGKRDEVARLLRLLASTVSDEAGKLEERWSPREWSPSEAVSSFDTWLTGRGVQSSPTRVQEFIALNSLQPPRVGFQNGQRPATVVIDDSKANTADPKAPLPDQVGTGASTP